MKFVSLAFIVLGLGLGAAWAWEHRQGDFLEEELAAEASRAQAARERLESENARWHQRRLESERLRQQNVQTVAEPSDHAEPRETTSADASTESSTLRRDRWTSSVEWKNRGEASANSALETTLWAAAGGDLAALKPLLQFDAASITRAEAVLRDLPPNARAEWASPEDYLTAAVAASVPTERAKLLASQTLGENRVAQFLVFQRADGSTHQTYLTMTRNDSGWKLIVPDRAAQKLLAGKL